MGAIVLTNGCHEPPGIFDLCPYSCSSLHACPPMCEWKDDGGRADSRQPTAGA